MRNDKRRFVYRRTCVLLLIRNGIRKVIDDEEYAIY